MSCIPTFSCALATKGANANAEVAAMAWRRVTRDFILHLPCCLGRAAAASEAGAKLTTLQQQMGGWRGGVKNGGRRSIRARPAGGSETARSSMFSDSRLN